MVVIALAVAGVVALWPRATGDGASAPQARGAPWQVDGPSSMAAPAGPEIDALRADAALRPCPGQQDASAPPAGPLVGITAPCLGSPGLVDLSRATTGRPALLNVWASWCGPCREEIPVLDQYARRPGAIPVIGIDVRDDPAAALRLLAQLGATYPSVVDTDGALWRALKVPNAIPANFVLRADGSIRSISPQLPFRSPDEVAAVLQRYLNGPTGASR